MLQHAAKDTKQRDGPRRAVLEHFNDIIAAQGN